MEDIELQVLSTKQSRSRSSSISAPSQTCQALPFGAESENPRLLESYPTKTDAGLCDQSQGARININCRGSTDGGYLQPFPVNIHAKDGVRHSTLKANSVINLLPSLSPRGNFTIIPVTLFRANTVSMRSHLMTIQLR